jgi:hypothetical protein
MSQPLPACCSAPVDLAAAVRRATSGAVAVGLLCRSPIPSATTSWPPEAVTAMITEPHSWSTPWLEVNGVVEGLRDALGDALGTGWPACI